MASSKTYYVGLGPYIKRLDNVVGAGPYTWLNLPLAPTFIGTPQLLDVQTVPGNINKVVIVGKGGAASLPPGTFPGIAVSVDAGVTWTVPGGNWLAAVQVFAATNPGSACNVYKIWATDSTYIYVAAQNGLLFKSADGGLTFNTLPSLPAPLATEDITSLHFPSNGEGVIGVTTAATVGYLVQTLNDGANWYILNSSIPLSTGAIGSGKVRSVFFSKADNLVLACCTNAIYKSTVVNFTTFTNVHNWAIGSNTNNRNGRHMTWFESGSTRIFRAVGSNYNIIKSSDDFSTPAQIINAYVPTTGPCSQFPMYNYTGAHFYNQNNGFYTVSTCPWGAVYSSSFNSITTNPGVRDDFVKEVAAVWTGLQAPVCYKLTDCTNSAIYYITPTNLSAYLGQVVNIQIAPIPPGGFDADTVDNEVLYGRVDGCFTVSLADSCRDANPVYVQVTVSYVNCNTCVPSGGGGGGGTGGGGTGGGGTGGGGPLLCINLINCLDDNDVLVYPLSNQFSFLTNYLNKYIKFNTCLEKCYYVTYSSNCGNALNTLPGTIVGIHDSCEECIGVQVVNPANLNTRSVKPGFSTPGCPPEYTVKTSCAYASQVYDEMVSLRYGITICCDHDIDKWDIKKQLLDLASIYDPELCLSSVINCDPPCNVEGSLFVCQPIPGSGGGGGGGGGGTPCPPPTSVVGSFGYPVDPCPFPDPPDVSVNFIISP